MNPEIVVIGTILFGTAFWLGWVIAVGRHEVAKRRLASQIDTLDTKIKALNEEISTDPQRAWIDHGQRYVIHQIETTLRGIREQMEKH